MEQSGAIEIPWRQLSSEALQGMLEELVTRDGTDYGAEETPVEVKVAQLRAALESDAAMVTFCPETETWTVLKK